MAGTETMGTQVGINLLDVHQSSPGVAAGTSGMIGGKRGSNNNNRIIPRGTGDTVRGQGVGQGGREGANQVGAGDGAVTGGLSGRCFNK